MQRATDEIVIEYFDDERYTFVLDRMTRTERRQLETATRAIGREEPNHLEDYERYLDLYVDFVARHARRIEVPVSTGAAPYPDGSLASETPERTELRVEWIDLYVPEQMLAAVVTGALTSKRGHVGRLGKYLGSPAPSPAPASATPDPPSAAGSAETTPSESGGAPS